MELKHDLTPRQAFEIAMRAACNEHTNKIISESRRVTKLVGDPYALLARRLDDGRKPRFVRNRDLLRLLRRMADHESPSALEMVVLPPYIAEAQRFAEACEEISMARVRQLDTALDDVLLSVLLGVGGDDGLAQKLSDFRNGDFVGDLEADVRALAKSNGRRTRKTRRAKVAKPEGESPGEAPEGEPVPEPKPKKARKAKKETDILE